jgi:hypothetical protein
MLKKTLIILLFAVVQPLAATGQDKAKPQHQGSPSGQFESVSPSPVEPKPVSQSSDTASQTQTSKAPADNGPKITDWAQAITSVFILAVIIVQAGIYWKQRDIMARQWITMRRGLVQTRRLIRLNESQSIQNEMALRAAQRHANATLHQMRAQSEAMKSQADAALIAAKAAEESARIAQHSFHTSERPHFGITGIDMAFEVGRAFSVSIVFMNGGKTPAWHFNGTPWITLGHIGAETMEGKWSVRHQVGDLHNSFWPAGIKRGINYGETEFKVTQEIYDKVVVSKTVRLYVRGTARWVDSRGEHQHWDFWAVYYPSSKRFGDYLST